VAISKPCEASALRAHQTATGTDGRILLSFFCAGTPSQRATESLISHLGTQPDDVSYLRYRGRGWPGDFYVEGGEGEAVRTSYEESWGSHLGRDLQWRCKICADATGESADVAVGDFWRTDERGYPIFEGADGVSVVLARTDKGRALLAACVAAGVIALEPVDVDDVARIQPLQVNRRQTLVGRLIGRRLAGKQIPRYSGYRLFTHVVRHPIANLQAALYTLKKSRG
jgi:coenzyme F420 hydrogenase subunit beta